MTQKISKFIDDRAQIRKIELAMEKLIIMPWAYSFRDRLSNGCYSYKYDLGVPNKTSREFILKRLQALFKRFPQIKKIRITKGENGNFYSRINFQRTGEPEYVYSLRIWIDVSDQK